MRVLRRRSRSAKVSRSSWARWAAGGLAAGSSDEHPVDERAERLRQVRPGLGERRGAGLDPPRRLEQRAVPERMPAGERLPSIAPSAQMSAARPARLAVHAARAARRRASRARRRWRSATPPRRAARARSRAAARTSSSPSASRTLDGLTSRWTIPRACACARPSSTCAAVSTAAASSSSPARSRLPHGLSGDVLVGDVDVRESRSSP